MKETTKKIVKKEYTYNPEKALFKEKNEQSKKILVVFDGLKFSESVLNYAIQLTKETDASLIGLFLEETIYRSYDASEILRSHKNGEQVLKQMAQKDQEKREKSVKQFQKVCDQAGITYTFHRNTNVAINELKQQSIFADLIIINKNETFSRFTEKLPTRFIKELLTDVQCPVLLVPDRFKPLDKIILLYDGGPSSVFAIKMFSYLFTGLPNVPVEVFTVKENMVSTHLPNNDLVREFIKSHFPKAKYIVGKGDAEEQILAHLRYHKGNELVVLGAYRRSELSRWFKTSMADILMKELNTPLFIAHNK